LPRRSRHCKFSFDCLKILLVPTWITMLSMSPGLRALCNSSWNQARLRRLPRLLQPPSPQRLRGRYPQRWPLKRMRRSLTCLLPSPDKREPDPVAGNKSRSLMPLILMAQVRAYPPEAGCRGLDIMC
jgi:hypothetical protein